MKYIAYGSNLNESQMSHRCPTSEKVGSGIIKDYELLFKGRENNAVATIEPKLGAFVQIGIWEIQEIDEKELDRYEGFPHLYQKETLKVCLHDGTTMEGMVYIMDDRYPVNLPNYNYLCTIQKGYRDFELDIMELFDAYNHTSDIALDPYRDRNYDMRME